MSTRKNLSDFLTIPQAAKRLGLTRQAISIAITRKRIKVYKIGHIRLITRSSLEQYKTSRKRTGRPRKKTK